MNLVKMPIKFFVSDIQLLINSLVDGLLIDRESGSRHFFCDSDNPISTYSLDVVICSVSDFPTGELLYRGEPWGELQMPYRWFVELVDDKTAIKICFEGQAQLNWAMMVIDHRLGVLTCYLDVTQIPFVFDPFLYPLGILVFIYLVHHHGGLVVHASGVLDGDNGCLFTGLSGVGKSTMARLWSQKGASVVNDDRLILMPHGTDYYMHNTPMPYYTDVPKQASLKGIFLLSQSPVNCCTRITGAVAMMRFMANCMQHLHSNAYVKEHLAIVEAIAAKVPIYELGFKPDTDVVDLVRQLNLS